jgi:phage gpG-like protein
MLRVRIPELDKIMAKCNGNTLLGKPIRTAFNKSVITLENRAKELTPWNTGRLRSSITHDVDDGALPTWGKVGTNVEYAPHVEWGTKPHWAPIDTLQPGGRLAVWGGRHGMNAAQVWWSIGLRGTKGAHMFASAIEQSRDTIAGYFRQALAEVKRAWDSGTN